MTPGELLVALLAVNVGAYTLAGMYVRRKLWKIDAIYDAFVGTPERSGIRDRIGKLRERTTRLENEVFGVHDDDDDGANGARSIVRRDD
jgi:hypothetical protein